MAWLDQNQDSTQPQQPLSWLQQVIAAAQAAKPVAQAAAQLGPQVPPTTPPIAPTASQATPQTDKIVSAFNPDKGEIDSAFKMGQSPAPEEHSAQAPAQASPSAAAPASMPSVQAPAVLSYQDWLAKNGNVPVPGRPRGPLDKIPDGMPGADSWANQHPTLRRLLLGLTGGLAEFAGHDPWGSNGHAGEGEKLLQPWLGGQLAAEEAKRQYDANLPAAQEQANQAAYQKYVQDAHVAAQTNILGQMATVQLPNGQFMQVPLNALSHIVPAQFTAQSRENVAHINAQSKEQVENLKLQIEQGQVSHFMANRDGTVTGFNKQGTPVVTLDNALLPSMMAKTSSTVDWKEDQFGNFHPLPKTTVTAPGMPGAAPAAGPGPASPGSTPQPANHGQHAAGAGNAAPFQGKGAITQVIGYEKDPATGASRAVMVPASEAQGLGLAGISKADAGMVEKTTNARMLLSLFNNSDPNDPGAIQVVENLDKEGKLGVLASRWNEFLAGTYGSGDPEFEKLRVLTGLGNTALMQVHVGNRGGAFMLEHFEDLANAKKLDGPTLLAGLQQEYKYILHKAMLPSGMSMTGQPQAQQPQGPVDWSKFPKAD